MKHTSVCLHNILRQYKHNLKYDVEVGDLDDVGVGDVGVGDVGVVDVGVGGARKRGELERCRPGKETEK